MNARTQSGSALLDALLATGLLVASAWLAAHMLLDSTRQADLAAERMQAASLATQQLATLEWHTQHPGPLPPGEDTPDTAAPGGFTRRWHNTFDPATAQHTWSVEIEWRDRLGKIQRLQRQLLVFPAAALQPHP